MPMLKETKRLADRALSATDGHPAEISNQSADSALTRFANNEIHQNVAQYDTTISIRVGVNRRWGIASTNDFSDQALEKTATEALEIAKAIPDSNRYAKLLPAQPYALVAGYDVDTAEHGPMQRAAAVRTILDRASSEGLAAAGAYKVEIRGRTVANSEGLFAHHIGTTAELMAVAMDDDSSGHARQISSQVQDINPDVVADEAVSKALAGRNPKDLPAADYEVVLEEFAVSDMLDFLGYAGFGGLSVEEGRSFMSGKLGTAIAGPNITIWDDPLDHQGIPRPFDAEGMPAHRVDLVKAGVAVSPVHDRVTAAKVGAESTGHALPPQYPIGPLPTNMFLGPGNTPKKTLITSTKRGLLINRFWYTRVVHPLTMHMTGTTRDGTFLIEDGEITSAVRNLRFTESYLAALNQVEMISAETKLVRDFFSVNRVPALKIQSWHFTGS